MVVDDRPCVLEIIDTAGRDEHAALGENHIRNGVREDHIRNGDAFIIAYSITSRESFSHVRAYYDQIKEVKMVLAENTLQLPPSERPCRVPIILVGMKNDLEAQREVSFEEGRRYGESLDCWFHETSAKTGSNVERTFNDVIRCFRQQDLPSSPAHPGSKQPRKGQNGRKVYDPRRCITL